MNYIRLSEGIKNYKLIPESDNIWDHIKDPDNTDYYTSIFKYNEEQYKQWKATGTIKGVTSVTTNKLVFDFDSASSIDEARKDALVVINRLVSHGVEESSIQTAFSGSKGFSIIVDTDRTFNPEEFKSIAFALAKDLKTFDKQIYDPSRIFRVIGTKHLKSGLLKMPLSIEQLATLPISDIKNIAKSIDNVKPGLVDSYTICTLPDTIYNFRVSSTPKKEVKLDTLDFDLSKKPKWLSQQKYALQEGFFIEGERNTAFMVLASTYKNQGFPKEIVYRMLKGVAEKQAIRNNCERYPDEELWANVVGTVYSPDWKGGSYSYDNTPLLQDVSERLSLAPPDSDQEPERTKTNSIGDVFTSFKDYANNLDKLTIKFGIPDLDRKMRATVGMSIGLIAGPGVGKTSLTLAALNFMSKSGELCIFFSYDMYSSIVYQKLVQRHFNLTMEQVLLKLTGKKMVYKETYEFKDLKYQKRKILEETEYTATFDFSDKHDPTFGDKIDKKLKEEYGNVEFCFASGQSCDDIEKTILQVENKYNKKVRFIAIDYNELITTDLSDSTAASNYVAQRIRGIAISHSLCALQLFQPTKLSGTPADEIKSYHAAKGGGGISQSVSIMLTMSRPGYSPDHPEDDIYARINCVKNRMGELFKVDLGFKGLTGEFTSLDDEDKKHLKAIIEDRERDKQDEKKGFY